MRSMLILACCLMGASAPTAEDNAGRSSLQRNLADVLEFFKRADMPLANQAELETLVKADPEAAATTERIQALLDPLCLVSVTINPESRVKAARGAAAAELRQSVRSFVMIKVQNDGGVTSALSVSGDHVRERGKPITADTWLSAQQFMRSAQLTGQPVQYVLLALGTTEAGKREARLVFDVGQGTQDLGFRAEVPILFTIRAKQ